MDETSEQVPKTKVSDEAAGTQLIEEARRTAANTDAAFFGGQ